jgi:hypothetical protein
VDLVGQDGGDAWCGCAPERSSEASYGNVQVLLSVRASTMAKPPEVDRNISLTGLENPFQASTDLLFR